LSTYEYFELVALENLDIKVSEQVIEKLTYLLEIREYKNLPWLAGLSRLKLPWYEQSYGSCDDDDDPCKIYAFTRYQQIRLCAALGYLKLIPITKKQLVP
jgi:hypothetical protein